MSDLTVQLQQQHQLQQQQKLPRLVTQQEIVSITSQPSFIPNLIVALWNGFGRINAFYMAPIQTLGCPPVSPPFAIANNRNDSYSTTTSESVTTTKTTADSNVNANVNVKSYSAQTCVKTGYYVDGKFYVIKIASGGHPFPTNSGLMQLYSQQTGKLECILFDDGMLTEIRTGAIGSLVFSVWAPYDSIIVAIGIVGCGVQARYQLQCLASITSCRTVLVYGRTQQNVQQFCTEMYQANGWMITAVSNPNVLLQQCTVIITTTSATDSLLTTYDPTTSITKLLICIGSDSPGKSEVSDSILYNATYCIADLPEQSYERGEFQGLLPSSSSSSSSSSSPINLVSLTDALQNTATHRRRIKQPQGLFGPTINWHQKAHNDDHNDDDNIYDENNINYDGLIVFDSSGLALQDYVIAEMVYTSLLEQKRKEETIM